MKFKFISAGINHNEVRKYLPAKGNLKTLPLPFKYEDIAPNTFSKSVMKRLKSVKNDDVKIKLRSGPRYFIGIISIDQKSKKSKKNKLSSLKRQLTLLRNKNSDVVKFFNLLKEIEVKSKYKISREEWLKR